MWGQDFCVMIYCGYSGIIPTRVGTRIYTKEGKNHHQDHPHACGDKCCVPAFVVAAVGSSPRVWGQVFTVKICTDLCGIIPTRVGTSFSFCFIYAAAWDHPHACGDKKGAKSKCAKCAGSSPRVWGQVTYRTQSKSAKGIIPTRVGTSELLYVWHSGYSDHPHACGDKTKEIKENSGFAKSTA